MLNPEQRAPVPISPPGPAVASAETPSMTLQVRPLAEESNENPDPEPGERVTHNLALDTAGAGIIRRQVIRLIDEVLCDPVMGEEARSGLLHHLTEHPGEPELALLAHLKDLKDP